MTVSNVRWEGFVAGNALLAGSVNESARQDVISSIQSTVNAAAGTVIMGSIVIADNTFTTSDVIRCVAHRFSNVANVGTAFVNQFRISGTAGTANFIAGPEVLGMASGVGLMILTDVWRTTHDTTKVWHRAPSTTTLASGLQFTNITSNVGTWTPTGTFVIFAEFGTDGAGSVFVPNFWVERVKL